VDGIACLDSTDSYELQELRDLGTESEGDCSNTEDIYSGDADDCEFVEYCFWTV